MKISEGVSLAWELAAQETIIEQKSLINPVQFMIAIGRLHQVLQDGNPGKNLPDNTNVKALKVEINRITHILSSHGVDIVRMSYELRRRAGKGDHHYKKGETVHRSDSLKSLFDQGLIIADHSGCDTLMLEHIFLAILQNPNLLTSKMLKELKIDPEDTVKNILCGGIEKSSGGTPLLDEIGKDLTALAKAGRLGPVIGRRREVLQVIQALARRTKNNPVLIGEAGVGKTAIIELLAIRIYEGKDPGVLANKRLIEIPMGHLVAGTSSRGELESRLKQLIRECETHPEIIVFMDELHTLVSAGGISGGVDPANILKPALARGGFQFIGATTTAEYARFIEPDSALERRFEKVIVREPSVEETIKILEGIRPKLEDHHKAVFPGETLQAAVELSFRFDGEHRLPDKAIDLIDKAGAKTRVPQLSLNISDSNADPAAKGNLLPEVKRETVAEVLAEKLGVPREIIAGHFSTENKSRLLELEKYLNGRVIGQSDVTRRIAERLITNHADVAERHGPQAVFLFTGQTGVGKTEMARALASYLFGSEQAIIRFDMSEYMEEHSVAKLIGSPPGYVGHEEEGQLTGKLRARPYAIVLLDEIDKAHPKVLDIFLQVFDDARLTDAKGRVADARHAVFIMTSNIQPVFRPGFGAMKHGLSDSYLMDELKTQFRPEFLNRINELCIFRSLSIDDTREIVRHRLDAVGDYFRSRHGKTVEFNESVVEYLASAGYSEQYGVRELHRILNREVEAGLARLLIGGEVEPWVGVTVKVENGRLIFTQSQTTA